MCTISQRSSLSAPCDRASQANRAGHGNNIIGWAMPSWAALALARPQEEALHDCGHCGMSHVQSHDGNIMYELYKNSWRVTVYIAAQVIPYCLT